MNIQSIKCPECNATLNVDIANGQHECYCSYCGAKITLDDYMTSHVYRKVDEARIKEAEIKKEINMKKAEDDKAIRMKELEVEAKRAKANATRIIAKLIGFLALALIAVIFMILGESDYEWRDLQTTGELMLIFIVPIAFILFCWTEKK